MAYTEGDGLLYRFGFGTLYYAEHVHIAQTQTQIPSPV